MLLDIRSDVKKRIIPASTLGCCEQNEEILEASTCWWIYSSAVIDETVDKTCLYRTHGRGHFLLRALSVYRIFLLSFSFEPEIETDKFYKRVLT